MATNRLVQGISTPTVDFYLQADELSYDVAANTHVVRCYLVAVNRGNTSTFYSYTDASVSGSVEGIGFGVSGASATLASGTPNGGTFWSYGPYDITVNGNADGTASADLTLVVSYPNAASTGGSKAGSFALTTLTAVPGVPASVALARNSDTQATLTWEDTSASNGAPTSNQIQTSVNGAGFSEVASISPSTSLVLAAAANQKILAQVRATNSAGSSAWSASSNAVFTTPAAPTNVVAAKDAALDITVSFTSNVGFTEHQHVVEHGTVASGVTTWDASPLASLASGTISYKHVAPDPAKVHVYRVFPRNTDTGALEGTKVLSNEVQLLAAPNAPTLATPAAYQDKAAAFTPTWTHNPVDTTPQTAYEMEYSLNGGAYATTGKITSTTSSKTFAASTYLANDALTYRVRTYGESATASPWSDTATVTFKTRPVATIASPADLSTWAEADLRVGLGFSQAEGAAFVSATIVLAQGTTTLETVTSTTLASTDMATDVANGGSYKLTVTVLDSNGLTSDAVVSTFSVAYTLPVAAGVVAAYLEDSGIGQLDLTIPAAGVGEAEAVAVTIYRTIDGTRETVTAAYPVSAGTITILDTTPTINGTNSYLVRTISADGATKDTLVDMVTTEDEWAYLNTGAGFDTIVRFSRRLVLGATPARQTALVGAAGRTRPIALFGENKSLEVFGSATVLSDEVSATLADGGSSIADIEEFLLTAGRSCLRDPSGRRVLGAVSGSFSNRTGVSAEFQFVISEAT